jgi:lipooligosaccharide transport system permease protein
VIATLGRVLAGSELHAGRAFRVTERNVVAFRTSGWGVGALVGDIPLPDGRVVPYLTFLAPGLLTASIMNGAIAESTRNFYTKMRSLRLYDSVLNTPVTPVEIAFGELVWAMMRGALYSGVFLLIMAIGGLTSPIRAIATLPVALLVAFAFGALGMALATILRSWQDFDYVGIVQFAVFLFSGTFVPVSSYPAVMQWIVHLSPLYHGVELIRALSTTAVGWSHTWNLLYLVAAIGLGLAVAGRRTFRLVR